MKKLYYTFLLGMLTLLTECRKSLSEDVIIGEIEPEIADYRCDAPCVMKRLTSYPTSEFLNAMYFYLIANEENVEVYIDRFHDVKSKLEIDGTFTSLAEAHMLRLAGKRNEASEILSAALSSGKAKHWLFLELAALYNSADSSISMLDSALRVKPDFYRAKVAKAYLIDVTVDSKRIISLLEGTETLPKDTTLYSFLAEAYFFSGNFDKSVELFRKSVEIGPNSRAYIGLGNYFHYEHGDLPKALEYYNLARALDSTSISILRSLGWVSLDLRDSTRADSYFGEILNRRQELDFMELEDLFIYFLTRHDFENARLIVDDMKSRFGESYKALGYDLLIRWNSSSDEIFELMLEQYEKKYGGEAKRWLESKLDYFGYAPRIQIIEDTDDDTET